MTRGWTAAERREAVRGMLEAAWQPQGFCVPNLHTYPFQWLWDSCFHSLIWADLGDERAVIELTSALAHQDPSGMVPHMTYWCDPDHSASFWGRPLTSTITQPPMYGHAVAGLVRRGFEVPADTIERAVDGLRFLLKRRARTTSGLVAVIHPWETGCDDSPRWDRWRRANSSVAAWRDQKGSIVQAISRGEDPFRVGSVGFNALIAWNALELIEFGWADDLRSYVGELIEVIRSRWDAEGLTWSDDQGADGDENPIVQIRTIDALLCLLVDPRNEAVDQLVDPDAFGGRSGPAGVHRAESAFDPGTYWRGGSWPQLSYLLWNATSRMGRDDVAAQISAGLRSGAEESSFSEYWHPDTARGLGARPQTWSGLAICV